MLELEFKETSIFMKWAHHIRIIYPRSFRHTLWKRIESNQNHLHLRSMKRKTIEPKIIAIVSLNQSIGKVTSIGKVKSRSSIQLTQNATPVANMNPAIK